MAGPAHVLGIAGPSGSGKTALARVLCSHLPQPAVVVPMDAYYRDLRALDLAARARVNFDHPDALDRDLLLMHLERLAAGESVARPIYEFATHTRAPRTERVGPATFLIVEGLLVLYWEEVRRLLQTAVFVDLEDDLCLARRLARDTAERGRPAESVRAQYAETVRPMREQYVMPTRRFADLVVSGAEPLEASALRILVHLGVGGRESHV